MVVFKRGGAPSLEGEESGRLDRGLASEPSSRWFWPVLLLIVLAAAGLRSWYAAPVLSQDRFWDERYTLGEVRNVFTGGEIAPVRAYYPSPVVSVPPALLLKLAESLGAEVLKSDELTFTPAAYVLCRGLNVVFGTLTLVLVACCGRFLFASPLVGVLAALLLAFTPAHLLASVYFKPDAPVVCAVVLAFYLSLRAVRGGSAGWYALAGVAIALAMSYKLTGGVIALPLVLGTLVNTQRTRRERALMIGVGAVVSAGVFVALNPYWTSYLSFLGTLREDYASRSDESLIRVAWRAFTFAGRQDVLRPLLGGLALLAYLPLIKRALFDTAERRAQILMLLSFPVLFTALYLAETNYFKGNNFVPIVPFLCLNAAWIMVVLGRRMTRFRLANHAPVRAVAACALVAYVASHGATYVYRRITPTTQDAVLRALTHAVDSPRGRLVAASLPDLPWPPFERSWIGLGERPAIQTVDRLSQLSSESLDRMDGEIFPARELDGPDAAFYRRRFESLAPSAWTLVEPRWGEHRGEPLLLLLHPWEARAEPLSTRASLVGESFVAPLPDGLEPGEVVSLYLRFPTRALTRSEERVEHAGQSRALWLVGRRRRGRLLISERFEVDPDSAIVFPLRQVEREFAKQHVGVTVFRWRRPADPRTARAH